MTLFSCGKYELSPDWSIWIWNNNLPANCSCRHYKATGPRHRVQQQCWYTQHLLVTFCYGRALGGSRWPGSPGTWPWGQGDVRKCPDGVCRCRYWSFTQHLLIAFCFKLALGELSLNSGHHFGLYAASSDLEAKVPYMATIFRVQGPLANHPWPPARPQRLGTSCCKRLF